MPERIYFNKWDRRGGISVCKPGVLDVPISIYVQYVSLSVSVLNSCKWPDTEHTEICGFQSKSVMDSMSGNADYIDQAWDF